MEPYSTPDLLRCAPDLSAKNRSVSFFLLP